MFSSLHVSRWTSTSPCPCCSAWQRIWSTTSCWIRRRAVRTLLSRCVWSQPSPSPHTPPQCTGRPSPSTLSWERPTNWTAWKNLATVPSVNRSVLRVKRSTVTYEESYPLAFIFTSVEVVKLEQGTPLFFLNSKAEFSASITPVFNITWYFSSHSNILFCCWSNLALTAAYKLGI